MLSHEQFLKLIEDGDLLAIRSALEEDASLANARDNNGVSAALISAYHHEPLIARLMVKFGAQLSLPEACAVGILELVQSHLDQNPAAVNVFAEDGFQPLGLASYFGHADVVEALLQAGAAVNQPARNPSQVTPLHSAVAGRNAQIVELLLEHSARVNARQNGGFTPLHAAAQNGDLEIVTLLVEAGADINLREYEGKSALDFAREGNHPAVIDYLSLFNAQ